MNLEEKASEIGSNVLVSLHSLSSVLKLYETNNSAVTTQIDTITEKIQSYFEIGGQELRITLREDEFFVNDRLLKVDLPLYMRAREVSKVLGQFLYDDIRFMSGCTREVIETFVKDLSESIRSNKSSLKSDYGQIAGKKSVGSSASALRFEPDKLAIWLYSGLLDVVEQLYTFDFNEKVPSLLPIRRSLQMIIDNMAEYNGIYQMLSAIRDPSQPRSKANSRVAMAIDAVGFGLFINLPGTMIMELALSGVLGGLSDSDDPIESVAPLFAFKGLGEASLGLILTLHDARSARKGKPTGIAGKILMVVEAYHQTLDTEMNTPLPEVIYKMASGQVDGLDSKVGELFARYKGLYPIGSIVQIGRTRAVVVGHPDNEKGKKRPLLYRLGADGNIEDAVDLTKRKDIEITKALSACREGIQLADL